MAQTAFADAFKKAGANPNGELLYAVAAEQLRKVESDPTRAMRTFLEELKDAPALALELIPEATIRNCARAYLERVARDMRGKGLSVPSKEGDGVPRLFESRGSGGPVDEKAGEGGAQTKVDRQLARGAPSPVPSSAGEGAQTGFDNQSADRPSPAETQAEGAPTSGVDAVINLARPSAPIPEKAEGGSIGPMRASEHMARPSASPKRGLAEVIAMRAVVKPSVFESIKLRDGRSIGELRWSEIDRFIGANKREAALLKLVRDWAVPADPNARVSEIVSSAELERMVQKAAEITDET